MTAREARNVGLRWNEETQKYEGYIKDASKIDIKAGLQDNVIDDSNKVIEIENKYRDFHGLPRRSGTDHGYIHAGTVTVKP